MECPKACGLEKGSIFFFNDFSLKSHHVPYNSSGKQVSSQLRLLGWLACHRTLCLVRRTFRVHLLFFSAMMQDYAQIHSGVKDSCHRKAVTRMVYFPPLGHAFVIKPWWENLTHELSPCLLSLSNEQRRCSQ